MSSCNSICDPSARLNLLRSPVTETDRITLANYEEVKALLKNILEWLWDIAADPVLEFLHFTDIPLEGN